MQCSNTYIYYTCKKFVHRVSEMLDKFFFQLNYLIEIKLISKIRFQNSRENTQFWSIH